MGYSAVRAILLLLLSLLPVPSWAAQVIEPLKEALELHESGKIKEAIALYDSFIKSHPKRAEGYFNRGNAYYDLGQNQHAVKDYSEAIRLWPKDAEAYFNRGNAYRDSEQRIIGALGVIGPTRLNYARIVPMVDYTAQLVSRLLR